MEIKELQEIYASHPGVTALQQLADSDYKSCVSVNGLTASSAACAVAGYMHKEEKQTLFIVMNDVEEAGYFYHDLVQICGDKRVLFFPSSFKRALKYGHEDDANRILRTEVMSRLASRSKRQGTVIVTHPEAVAEKVVSQEKMESCTLQLAVGGCISRDEVEKRLGKLGFKEVTYVYEPGEFAVRGSLIDIFSFSSEYPFRIDFFGDEIESIRSFEVETQLSKERLQEISIVPKLIDKESVPITSFLPRNTIYIAKDFSFVKSSIEKTRNEGYSLQARLSEEKLPEMPELMSGAEIERHIKSARRWEIHPSQGGGKEGTSISFDTSMQPLFNKDFDLASNKFKEYIGKGYKIMLLADDPRQAERLKSIFAERGDEITFTAINKTIHAGFIDNTLRIALFTDHQLFGRFHNYRLRSDRARGGKTALTLKELSEFRTGDYIVHIDHGIGKFGGLVRIPSGDTMQEAIKLYYKNDDVVFVSIHNLHKISKYKGKEGDAPTVNKLGTGAWERIKERTKKKRTDSARDLRKLYSERYSKEGFAFTPDTYLQHELEASFIYEDTPDQITATQAVKADMESARPMDRLICGDVGFGKTEIAIRAAFKAAVDGKQTAVLVPTTVLAMQHYHTFSERLKELPVRVDFISRARKPKDVKQIIADLADGKIDILIGTHKIIGKEIRFKDLGLLVVDEEQKFGVAVKEKLKQMKVNVDTLTMSATPIPRTLQFSLMGARDLSSLNTPPANRQPIVTSVTTFNDDIIAEAVNFELSRNGQIFFICNRIEQLQDVENTLRRLVPDVRVISAHGQMPAEKLEKAIIDFANHDYDVLLSTTIIESGIDMPNVNTIIINNAQNFGLSELHQLRGRVGRSSRKAFCYLLVPPAKPLTVVARRRLQAIESFSDLGAGIHIAMQDLDIRGAGNLLGAEQSGFIADLGYETYQKILRESVIELKTEEFGDTFTDENAGKEEEFVADCTIESDMELRIPAEYVPQEGERISLYQELDNMERLSDVEAFRERLCDRFGAIPHVTQELILIVPLRSAAKQLGIEKLYLKQGKMFLYFVDASNQAYYNSAAFGRVINYLQLNARRCEIREKNTKRSMVINSVASVETALHILTDIRTLPSL